MPAAPPSSSGACVDAARVEAAARTIAGESRDAGGETTFVRADVSNAADVRATVDHTVRTFGGLDVPFNITGIEGTLGTTADYPDDAWQRALAVNLTIARASVGAPSVVGGEIDQDHALGGQSQ